ncbi:MAG TPA: hypothetical protein VFA70_06540, partial [Dehalococcoidia bacterium]|nr:hypothetical protein [Dehalococcoidia bacterium]
MLQAERARGCDDRTVIGGLDALARNLALRGDVAPGSPLSRVLIELRERPYGRLSPEERRRRIDG